MKVKQLRQIISNFSDEDEIAIRLFGGGLADIYNVKILKGDGKQVVLLSSHPDLSDILQDNQYANHNQK